MNIIILNFALNWVYRLYIDYLEGISFFLEQTIKKKFDIEIKNIKIKSILYEIDKVNSDIEKKKDMIKELQDIENNYDKIILTGDIGFICSILNSFKNKNKLYYLNIEQLSHDSYYKYFRTLPYYLKIIDYSEENIPYYNKIYNKSFLLSPYFSHNLNYSKTIDILSIQNNDYRKNILKQIQLSLKNEKQNYNIKFIDNIYGKERDILYNKSKVYINIHCSEKHQTMELIRLVNLLLHGVIIITQKSIYSNLLFIKDYLIICNNDNEIGTYVNYVLQNYDYFYEKIFIKNSFEKNKYEKYLIENYKKFITS